MALGTHSLAAHHLRLDRGGRALFDNLSFTVEPGHALVLKGANGSGKTSLLRVLAGLTLPDSGFVDWAGERMKALSTRCRAATLYLGHANALKDELSAEENLIDALAIDGVSFEPGAALHALGLAGLSERRQVATRRLSQGQKRRVGLARLSLALSHKPHKPLWLLDEPTNALDSEGVALFTKLIGDHLARGGIACIATHLALNFATPATALELSLDSPTVMNKIAS